MSSYILTPEIRPSPSLIALDSPPLHPVSLLDIDNYEALPAEFIDRLLNDQTSGPEAVSFLQEGRVRQQSTLDAFADVFLPSQAPSNPRPNPNPNPGSGSSAPNPVSSAQSRPLYQVQVAGSTPHIGSSTNRPGVSSSATTQQLHGQGQARQTLQRKVIRPVRRRSASPVPRTNLRTDHRLFHRDKPPLSLSPSPNKARSLYSQPPPLVDYDYLLSSEEEKAYPPSPPPSPSPATSTASTPDLTPDTSFSSNQRRIQSYPKNDDDEDTTSGPSILISDPSDIVGLFNLDIQPLPYPTESLISKPEIKQLPPKVEAALIDFDEYDDDYHDERFRGGTGFSNRQVEFQDFRQVVDPFGEPFADDLESRFEEYEEYASENPLFDISPPDTHSLGGSPRLWKGSAEYQDLIDSSLAKVKHAFQTPKPLRLGEKGYNVMSLLDSTSVNGSASTTSSQGQNATPTSIRPASSEAGVHAISPYSLLLANPSPRLTVPPELLRPSKPDKLQTGIMNSWVQTEPSKESRTYKKEFLKTLTRLVNGRFGNLKLTDGSPRFKVDVFGSVSWGGETGKSGDLDLVILDLALPQGYHPSLWRQAPDAPSSSANAKGGRIPSPIKGLPRVYHTFSLADCLQSAGMRDIQAIPWASTPIVKFRDTGPEALECDINANDLGGWFNSSLILHYCLVSPHLLRPLIHVLKLWASAHKLNDASGSKGPATMSSYCLTLMAIGYLQHRGCLPNLQADINVPPVSRSADEDPDVVWVSWSKDQGVPAHVAFARSPPAGWKSAEPGLTVADALRGFFAFFSSTPASATAQGVEKKQFDHRTEIVSVIQGGIAKRVRAVGEDRVEEDQLRAQMQQDGYTLDEIQRVMVNYREKKIEEEDKMGKGDRGIQPRNWSERRLVVQDPFLWAKNCAGMMSKAGLDRWLDSVDRAHRLLLLRGKEATIEELLYDPRPITPGTPRRGRGRGSPSPFGMGIRGSPIGRGGPRW
ncbi:hypothetical protein IAU59_003772 [Kwoniella sp. CBS 9459]